MTIAIVVRFTFEGIHRWKDAPQDSYERYLRDFHRHVFHVTARKVVTHTERDIEFIALKRVMQEYCRTRFDGPHNMSCETMAVYLLERYELATCEVSEDGENGALVVRDEAPWNGKESLGSHMLNRD